MRPVLSDGSNLKLTSGGTTFTIPSSDGSSGQFLKQMEVVYYLLIQYQVQTDDLTVGDDVPLL